MSQVDMPLKEAVELLTVGELGWIRKAFGTTWEDLSGFDSAVAVVLMHERRRALADGKPLPDRDAMDAWTIRQIHGYFAPEEVEVDEDDPETEQGKDSSPAA